MAFRIDKAIIRGWIDNTTPGITRGGLEIMGMERPVKILLRGNCWRDLAGTRIEFKNPKPIMQEDVVEGLHALQRGVVGDMTASKRVKAPFLTQEQIEELEMEDKDIQFGWKNALSLEWYSLVNGRVMLETTQYEMTITTHQWELDEEGEKKQIADNNAAMEHFMELMLTASEAQSEVKEVEGEVDEFEWEKRLRVRDTLEEAAWFLGEGPPDDEIIEYEVEEVSLKGREPLVQHAILVQSTALDLLGDSILDQGPRSDLALAVAYIYDTLDETWPAEEDDKVALENGYILAVLKRALEACNSAVAACNTLNMEDDRYEDLRSHVFHLRDLMIDKSHTLRD
ncbi:hypothetical protein ACFPK9_09475 [Rubritalea spongiae]|uniref:Uncharacterized protein n=1 Tax=Rubritalea spongiae TaxID=430797 RepID=A0ABW5E5D9_9BACT